MSILNDAHTQQSDGAKRNNSLNARLRKIGAAKKTRTSTGCPTATSTLRVYHSAMAAAQMKDGGPSRI
jgi:hypothetical protein